MGDPKDDPWRVIDCLSVEATTAPDGTRAVIRLDQNSYAMGTKFLHEFGRRKTPESRFIYAPGHSQLLCFHDGRHRSASFWVGPWYCDGRGNILINPEFIGDLVGKVQDISEVFRLLEPGEIFTIIDAHGVNKDVQAFPPVDGRVDSSKWTGRKELRRARQRYSVRRYAQIRSRYFGRRQLPVVWINKKYRRYFITAKYTVSFASIFGFSFIISVTYSILSGIVVLAILEILQSLRFFELTEITYPSPDLSKFPPKVDAKTSSTLDRNRWKDEGLLGSDYPDCLCIINFTNESEMLEFHRWLMDLSDGQLDDRNKRIRLSIVIEEDLTRYFICLMPNRDSWKKGQERTKEENKEGKYIHDDDVQVYEIAHDWSDRFEVPIENIVSVQRFLDSCKSDKRCALAVGHYGGRVLENVVIVHDFHLIMRSELSRKSHEYSLLKGLGYVPYIKGH